MDTTGWRVIGIRLDRGGIGVQATGRDRHMSEHAGPVRAITVAATMLVTGVDSLFKVRREKISRLI
jgi:hypothetical protein